MTTPPPLYQTLADTLEGMIRSGMFRPGDRIPSIRQTCKQHHVSVPTVLQAYTLLEDRRLIEARPKSGYYVRSRTQEEIPKPPLAPPKARALTQFAPLMALAHDVVNPDFVNLGGAHPSADLLPAKKLARLMASLARANLNAAVTCDPAPGSLRLRMELSRRSIDWGRYLPPEEFMITNGATEALRLALSATTQPGETVLLESPSHSGVLNILNSLRLRAIAIPSHPATGLDLEATEKALRRERVAAIVVVPNFNNPIGSLMPEENRKALVALAAAHSIPVIEDDVYGDLHFEGDRPHCLKAYDTTESVILCSSFSKTLAPGYRVGYIAGGRFQERILKEKSALNLSNTPLMALTIAEFLRTGGYEHHLRTLRRQFREQMKRMRSALYAAMPEGVQISEPQGGFVLWVTLPETVDALRLFHQAREAKISIAPGHLFSPSAEYHHHIRICCGERWSPRIEAAIAHLGQQVRALTAC